jgi:hypothetical protein
VTVFSETREGEGEVGRGRFVPRTGVPLMLVLPVPEPEPRLPDPPPTLRVSVEGVTPGEKERVWWEGGLWGISRLGDAPGSLC